MPKKIDLAFAVGLPPADAVKYFESKGYTLSWNWYDTWQEAHIKAFTVAKVMQMDILRDIRDAVDDAIRKGTTFEQFRKDLEPKLRAKGWWGKQEVEGPTGKQKVQLGSPYRLRTIYAVNTQTAYMAGRYKGMAENIENRPYWQYIQLERRTKRAEHAVLDGKVFPADDPIWQTHYPPNGWRCACRVRALSKQRLDRKGLKPVSSRGRLETRQQKIARNKLETAQVTRYTDPSGRTMNPEPGWNYNPGMANFKPDLKNYPSPIANAFRSATGQTPSSRNVAVSKAIDLKNARGAVLKAMERAISLVDKVHDDGELPKIYFIKSTDKEVLGYIGMDKITGRAKQISVSTYSPHKELTTLHEIGHFLDLEGFGKKGFFSSKQSLEILDDWFAAVRKSKAIKSLEKMKQERKYKGIHLSVKQMKFVNYLLYEHEIWARAYAQYIATKSGDVTTKEQVQLKRTSGGDIWLSQQWSDSDFKPIMEEMDRIFKKLGWIK